VGKDREIVAPPPRSKDCDLRPYCSKTFTRPTRPGLGGGFPRHRPGRGLEVGSRLTALHLPRAWQRWGLTESDLSGTLRICSVKRRAPFFGSCRYLAIMASFQPVPADPDHVAHARHLTPDLVLVAMAVSAYSWTNRWQPLCRHGGRPTRGPSLMVCGLLLAGSGCSSPPCRLRSGDRRLMINGLGLSVVTPAAYALPARPSPDDRVAGDRAPIGLAAMWGHRWPGMLGPMLDGASTAPGSGCCSLGLIASLGSRAPAQQQGTAFGCLYAVFAGGDRHPPDLAQPKPPQAPFAVAALVPAALARPGPPGCAVRRRSR
jgi:hypothetical protein